MIRARSRVHRIAVVLVVWAGLTSVSVWSVQRARSGGGIAAGTPITSLANGATALTVPAWLVVTRVGGESFARGLTGSVFVFGLGIGVWVGVGYGVMALCERAGGRRVLKTEGVSADLGRRRAIIEGLAGLGAVSVGASSVYMAAVTPWDLRIQRIRVPIRGLPHALDGVRVVQFGDLHLGPRVSREYLERMVSTILACRPDVALCIGDFVEGSSPRQFEVIPRILGPLTRAVPTLGVLGNHDHWCGPEAARLALGNAGMILLDNEHVFLSSERAFERFPTPGCLCIAGVDDLWEGTPDVDAAVRRVDLEIPRIMLAHNPDTAELPVFLRAAGTPRVDLMLSGHTHGGQVCLPLLGAPIVPSRFGGKYRRGLVEGPACRVLVTVGVGMSGIGVRIGVPPEIIELTLVRSDPVSGRLTSAG